MIRHLPALIALLALTACGKSAEDTNDTGSSETVFVDSDYDGVADHLDCDPNDPYTYPGADDIPYDGKDNDCCCETEGEDSECCGDLVDWDGDGYVAANAGGDDCNDGNPAIYPGAQEVCYDGIDQDCAGDEDSDDCDGDGHDRYTDCNDEDPSAYPGAEEVWYDGEDGDCSGPAVSDYDQDYDGQDHEDYGGTDCDDTDATIGVGQPERWDRRDRDCDGYVDKMNQRDSNAIWDGTLADNQGYLGMGAAILGDLDGDGSSEFIISGFGTEDGGYSGSAHVISTSSASSSVTAAQVNFVEGPGGSYGGWDLDEIGDLNGDSINEIVMGIPALSVSYLYDGASFAEGMTPTRLATLPGYDFSGGDIANLGDIDSDGYDDIAIGTSVINTAHLTIYGGGDLRNASGRFEDSIATITGGGMGGQTVGGLDWDADGVSDFLMGENVDTDGATIVISGADVAGSSSTSDYASLTGPGTDAVGSFAGWLPDVDGNGYDEIVVSAPMADEARGAVWVVDGSSVVGSQSAESVAMFTVLGTAKNGYLKGANEGGDFDGNGTGDLVVSAVGDFLTFAQNVYQGETWVFFGETVAAGGSVDGYDSSVTFGTTEADGLWGYRTLVGDYNGDGRDDLLFTAPAATGFAGTAALFYSGLE